MLNAIANFVDLKATRLVLGALGGLASSYFGPLAFSLAAIGVQDHDPYFLTLGLGGCFGLIAWWLRLFISSPKLARHPAGRLLVVLGLSIGTVLALYSSTLAWRNSVWLTLNLSMVAAGMLMILGTLRDGPGPNKSFKPNPLRGSA